MSSKICSDNSYIHILKKRVLQLLNSSDDKQNAAINMMYMKQYLYVLIRILLCNEGKSEIQETNKESAACKSENTSKLVKCLMLAINDGRAREQEENEWNEAIDVVDADTKMQNMNSLQWLKIVLLMMMGLSVVKRHAGNRLEDSRCKAIDMCVHDGDGE
ncbi:hypothetical protein HK407_07g12230 [Ordospora pajunii]|uniref:uncharacterized protein n=1 Tax=Ordospora pajunii TaxID=3039483 RepID=UPI0029527A7B|nr:uncharacterized protein HK407_07g12230 [Ordospora pajunii]KAH9411230.1 hypothetical protein HK407_07g12230 [Ordospora pajunii]